jgi:hypothetical protein
MQGAAKLFLLSAFGIAVLAFTQQAALAQPDVVFPADCDPHSSSRLESTRNCGGTAGDPVIRSYELEHKPIIITTPEIVSLECAAQIELQYLQKNTLANVEGTIENEMCAASSGTYVLSIRTRDGNSELTTQEFTETWAREDDKAVAFESDYEIGENVELVRIRAMKITCTCAGAE